MTRVSPSSSSAASGDTAVRQRVFVLLGAGRSGTSAMTRGLGALGIELGDKLKPPGRKNAKGFFEDRDVLDINYRLHDLLGLRRNGASLRLVPDPLAAPGVAALRQEAVATLRRRFGDCPLWGVKCIGMMRLLPFWDAVLDDLGAEVHYVVAIRHPLNVAGSRQKTDYFRGFQEKSDLEWLVHTVPHFRRARQRPCSVLDYDRLMTAPGAELRRIATDHALPLTPARAAGIESYASDFLSDSLRHNRTPDAAAAERQVNALTLRAYRHLLALARGESPDPADWAQIETELETLAPALRHIDRLEDALRGRLFGLNALWQTIKSRAMGGRGKAPAARETASAPS